MVAINWNPDRRTLAQFGRIGVVVFGLLGGLIRWRQHFVVALSPGAAETASYVLFSLAFLCLVLSWVAPGCLKPLYIGLSVVGAPIGFVVSRVVMAVVYFLVLMPIGLVFRLIGRDALTRRFDRAASTYWAKREPVTDVRRYYRQF